MTGPAVRKQSARSGSGWLRALAPLSLLAVGMAIGLGAGEILARLVFDNTVLFPRYHSAVHYGDYTLRRMRPDTTFWHTSRDGSWEFRTNAQGFRDDDNYTYAKSPGTIRVLVLGDSHTAGYEVSQEATFPEVIERYLRLRGVRVEVLNTGISGFGTAEQLAFLENEGVRYQPDVVVLGFFANDYEDAVRSGLFYVDDGRLIVRSHSYAPATSVLGIMNEVPPLRWLSENSHLYSVAMNTAWIIAKKTVAATAEDSLEVERAVPSEDLTDYSRDLVARLLGRMYAVARRAGARFIVVDIPVRRKWAADVPATAGSSGAKLATSVPEALRPQFRKSSDRFISSEEVLGDVGGILPLHRPHGHAHITEFTHALFGIAVAREILCGEHYSIQPPAKPCAAGEGEESGVALN